MKFVEKNSNFYQIIYRDTYMYTTIVEKFKVSFNPNINRIGIIITIVLIIHYPNLQNYDLISNMLFNSPFQMQKFPRAQPSSRKMNDMSWTECFDDKIQFHVQKSHFCTVFQAQFHEFTRGSTTSFQKRKRYMKNFISKRI